jgi:hypothetical protein
MADVTELLMDLLIGFAILGALFGIIIGFLNPTTFSWSALNIGGTVYSFSWVPYLLALLVIVGIVILFKNKLMKKGK